MVKSLDAFVNSLGDPGRFQVIAFLFLWSNTFPLAYNNFVMVYYGLPPVHHCKLPENTTWGLNDSVPTVWKKSKESLDSCRMYIDPSNHSLGSKKCDQGWTYETTQTRSIMGEWNLVCDLRYLISLSTSIYFVGVMFGGLLGGMVSDRFGRRPVILATLYLQAILGTIVAFSPNYELFVTLRFFQALLMQTLQTCSFTLTMELFKPRMRTVVGTVASMAWTIAVVSLALVASQIDNWRYLQLAVTLPSIISFFYFWFVPESMRWLISKQKIDGAENMANKILKFNNMTQVDVRDQIEKICEECLEGKVEVQKTTMLDLVKTPKLRKYTLILSFLWFTASLITYGVSYSLSSLGGNIYTSFCISGALDMIVRLLVIPILDRFGRRVPTIVSYFSSGACCLAVLIITYSGPETTTTEYLSMAAAVLGKAFVSACFAITPIYTTELYPTVIRALGQGLSVFSSRVGGILAPQLSYVGDVAWKPFPFVACGVAGVISALLAYFLPETHGMPLPDMIDDVEHPERRKYVAKSSLPADKTTNNMAMESKIEKIPELEGLTSGQDPEVTRNNNQMLANGFTNNVGHGYERTSDKGGAGDETDDGEDKEEKKSLTEDMEMQDLPPTTNHVTDLADDDTHESDTIKTSSTGDYFTPGRTPEEAAEAEPVISRL